MLFLRLKCGESRSYKQQKTTYEKQGENCLEKYKPLPSNTRKCQIAALLIQSAIRSYLLQLNLDWAFNFLSFTYESPIKWKKPSQQVSREVTKFSNPNLFHKGLLTWNSLWLGVPDSNSGQVLKNETEEHAGQSQGKW